MKKIVKEKTFNQICTRIVNNQFKNYKKLPCNSSFNNLIIECIHHEYDGIYIELKNNYKNIILKYIEENFKQYKKQ